MSTLDDLPPYRRAKLLWDYAHFGIYGIEDMIREQAGEPCPLPGVPVPASPRVAILGSDGRRHLMSDGQLVCSERASKQGWEHSQHCSWRETHQEPAEDTRGTYQWIESRWLVQLVDEGVPPDSVPVEQRCGGGSYGGFHYWPPPPAKTSVVRRLRAALVNALGPECHLCHALPGAMVDHDYATGLVRGLLCKFCNRVVEECPHVDGCPRADYMTDPPAAHLALRYPPYLWWKPKESTRQQKIALLGFDPLAQWRPS
ncbi:endonuclease domain-containing protein [Streptomyces sp. NPDC006335]|uniref:endonuclease domain-containing protein n=1 Tax=Streptomyces sp. NPDC006335 TaxID=3156895 RepID=UPI0033B4F0B6